MFPHKNLARKGLITMEKSFMKWAQSDLTLYVLKLFEEPFRPHGTKDLFTLYGQYHGCWWPGETRSQVISRLGTDLVVLEYSGFITRWVATESHYQLKLNKRNP